MHPPSWKVLVCLLSFALAIRTPAQSGALTLTAGQAPGAGLQLSWPSTVTIPGVGSGYPAYTLQQSSDLFHWSSVSRVIQGLPAANQSNLTVNLSPGPAQTFYRLRVGDITNNPASATGAGGAQVFGYAAAFSAQLASIGQISPATFASNFASGAVYLPQIDWDVTTAQFWTNFNADPSANTNALPPGVTRYDFRLNTNEMAAFQTNGFVVSERMSSPSFADLYYRVFVNDLPVFITADSILHAWHFTFNAMLEEIEAAELIPTLQTVLSGMSAQLTNARSQYGTGPLTNALRDVDFFLTVANSLMQGKQVPSAFGQDNQVAAALSAVSNPLNAIGMPYAQDFSLFGTNRWIDFSQFKVRGHYTDTTALSNYFQAVMWCALIDFEIDPDLKSGSSRQLGGAIVLWDILNRAGANNYWKAVNDVTTMFVGPSDSMNFDQLNSLMASENISSAADIPDQAALDQIRARLLTGELGVQSIRSGIYYYAPLGPAQLVLPRSFAVLGQKFVVDSWVFSEVTYDSILWTTNQGTNAITVKVNRRKPSSLDAVFAVLGNNEVVPELVSRITSTNGERFRDGLPYQHNLAATRNVIDSQDPSFWTNNIYSQWLWALRALSEPSSDPRYPESMRTMAWAGKDVNTQVASWTELRHDTLLYAKEAYSTPILCSYPYGFVEPRPDFWRRLANMASNASVLLSQSPFVYGEVEVGFGQYYGGPGIASGQITALNNFAAQMAVLESISNEELDQEPLKSSETVFLQNTIEMTNSYFGTRQFNGWYPQLFYKNFFQNYMPFTADQGSDHWPAAVADVFTDTPDQMNGDPGSILEEGVGSVNTLLIAVDNGTNRMIYAGPVMSQYEFENPADYRWTDSDWQYTLRAGQAPARPDWTRGWLVPGTDTLPGGY